MDFGRSRIWVGSGAPRDKMVYENSLIVYRSNAINSRLIKNTHKIRSEYVFPIDEKNYMNNFTCFRRVNNVYIVCYLTSDFRTRQ